MKGCQMDLRSINKELLSSVIGYWTLDLSELCCHSHFLKCKEIREKKKSFNSFIELKILLECALYVKTPESNIKLFWGFLGWFFFFWTLVPLLWEDLKRLLMWQKGKVFVKMLHLVGICSFWIRQLVTFSLLSLSNTPFLRGKQDC